MKTRKQRKYESVFEIDVDIIQHKRKANRLEAKAAQHTNAFKNCIINSHDPKFSAGECKYWQEQADEENLKLKKIRKRIDSIFEMQIPRLVRTRAALQTMPMAFLPESEGSVMQ